MNKFRNWKPATYNCTHALVPIMFITDTFPVKVNGFVVAHDFRGEIHFGKIKRINYTASCISQDEQRRGHSWPVRIHGKRGFMENMRTGDRSTLRVRKSLLKKTLRPAGKHTPPNFPGKRGRLTGACTAERIKYEKDNWNPDPERMKKGYSRRQHIEA